MKRIIFFMSLVIAICNTGMAQGTTAPKEKPAMGQGNHKYAGAEKPKGKYDKHKHRHKHFRHTRRHMK